MPIMLEGMSARLNEVLDKVAALYARVFTAAELREITAFYRGPTGQKFVNSQSNTITTRGNASASKARIQGICPPE